MRSQCTTRRSRALAERLPPSRAPVSPCEFPSCERQAAQRVMVRGCYGAYCRPHAKTVREMLAWGRVMPALLGWLEARTA